MRSFKQLLGISLVVALIPLLAGCYLFPEEEPLLAPPLMKPVEVSYNVVSARRGDIVKRVTGMGTFVSVEQQYMFFKNRGGRLKDVYVNLGDTVEKGDLLAELYTDNLESQIEQQKLALRKAQLYYQQVKDAGGTETQLELASIDVQLAQLWLDALDKELEQSRLYAEISGKVVYVDNRLGPGEPVGTYQYVCRIADPTRLQLQYSGINVSSFSVGNVVDVKIKNVTYVGTVVLTPATVPPDADNSLRNVVRIEVENLPEDVELGDTADITLVTERSEDTIIIPKQAVRNYMGRKYVNVLEDGLNNERDVEIGIETATEVEIVKGIEEGEQIILR